MRVLIAIHGYPPSHYGGAERRAERTARRLVAYGHDVQVLCVESASATHSGLRWDDTLQDGVQVRRLYYSLPLSPDPFGWSYDNPLIGDAVRELIYVWRPSVVHLFSGYLMSSSVVQAAVSNAVPVVISLTDFWWFCHRINLLRADGTRCDGPSAVGCARCQAETFRRFRFPARLIPKAADALWRGAGATPLIGNRLGLPEQIKRAMKLTRYLHSAQALIAPSRFLAEFYIQQGVDAKLFRVWRQGVEPEFFPRRPASEELRIGFLGSVKYHKGVDLVLEAWSRLRGNRPRRLYIYGSASGEAEYGQLVRQRIEPLGDVVWHGEIRGSEVWQALADLDAMVMPSRWVENSPNSILEAQAVGVPVIGSDLGGVAELVQHEFNGLLFKVDDANDLACQLQRLIDEPDLLPRLKSAPVAIGTVEDEVSQINSLYRELTRY